MKKLFAVLVIGVTFVIGLILIKDRFYGSFTSAKPFSKLDEPKKVITPFSVPAGDKPSGQTIYPISNYPERIKIRKFGQYFGPADPLPKMPCGKAFVGFHTGDDLEILPGEENTDVSVLVVADGKIASARFVNGYGGLLVETATLAGEPVTIYYGHLDLDSIDKKVGDEVKAGEQIAVLGKGCSKETDRERKHLHFAIKKGTDIDFRGYVQSEQALSAWDNPAKLLTEFQEANSNFIK